METKFMAGRNNLPQEPIVQNNFVLFVQLWKLTIGKYVQDMSNLLNLRLDEAGRLSI